MTTIVRPSFISLPSLSIFIELIHVLYFHARWDECRACCSHLPSSLTRETYNKQAILYFTSRSLDTIFHDGTFSYFFFFFVFSTFLCWLFVIALFSFLCNPGRWFLILMVCTTQAHFIVTYFNNCLLFHRRTSCT